MAETSQKRLKKFLNCYDAVPVWADIALVILLAVFVCWTDISWALTDNGPPVSDSCTHAYHSVIFHDTCAGVPTLGQSIYQFLTFRNHYPPLSYQIGEIGYYIEGLSENAPIVGMIPFTFMMALSMYGLCSFMGGRIAGLTGAVMSCTMPAFLEYSRLPFIDMQLAATTAFSISALLLSQNFTVRKASLACGAAIGLGMLSKWTFPVVIIIPLVASFVASIIKTPKKKGVIWRGIGTMITAILVGTALMYIFQPTYESPAVGPGWTPLILWVSTGLAAFLIVSLIHRGQPERSPLSNAFEALIVTLMIMGPWYAANRYQITYKVIYQANVEVNFHANLIKNLKIQNTWFFLSTLWLPIGLGFSLFRKETRLPSIWLVLSWALTLTSLSLAPTDPRYILPLEVFILGTGLCFMRPMKILALPLLLAACYMGFVQADYHNLASPPNWLDLEVLRESRPYKIPLKPAIPMRPRTESYPFKELLASMKWSDTVDWTGLLLAAPQVESAILQPRSLLYYAALEEQRLRIREVLLKDQEREPLYDDGQANNYMLMYRDPNMPPSQMTPRIYIEGDPITRADILTRAYEFPGFPKRFISKKKFHFGKDIIIELIDEVPAK